MPRVASIGFRTKTGKAVAIALNTAPEFIGRWNVDLYDPKLPPEGPHHEVLELPWPEALDAVRKYEAVIENVAAKQLREILDELQSRAIRVRAIGVVGSPDRNLEKIGNRHIRAHAAEGALFRHAVEVGASRCGLDCRVFSDRQLPSAPDEALASIGRAAGRPWRADERAAAAAAWVVLASWKKDYL